MDVTGEVNVEKRKRVTLTLLEKMEILKKLDNGVSVRNLCKEYLLGSSTIYDIKRQRNAIIKFYIENSSVRGISERRSLRGAKSSVHDSVLFEWFRQRRCQGVPISGLVLMEKAKQFHEDLKLEYPCEYSQGWLQKFKTRHGIQLKSTGGASGVSTLTCSLHEDNKLWKGDAADLTVLPDAEALQQKSIEDGTSQLPFDKFTPSQSLDEDYHLENSQKPNEGINERPKNKSDASKNVNIQKNSVKEDNASDKILPQKEAVSNDSIKDTVDVDVELEEGDYIIQFEEESNVNDEDAGDALIELEEEGCILPVKVEPKPFDSSSCRQLPKLQPCPKVARHGHKSSQPSSWYSSSQQSSTSMECSSVSDIPASVNISTSSNPDSLLSTILSENRSHNSELKEAMGHLTGKMDTVLSKFNLVLEHPLFQHIAQKRLNNSTEESVNKKKKPKPVVETVQVNPKLIASIIALEDKCEQLEKENAYLKNSLRGTSCEILSVQKGNPVEISVVVNKAMKSLYDDVESSFSKGFSYDGFVIRKTLAECISKVTKEICDSNIEIKSDEKEIEDDMSDKVKSWKSHLQEILIPEKNPKNKDIVERIGPTSSTVNKERIVDYDVPNDESSLDLDEKPPAFTMLKMSPQDESELQIKQELNRQDSVERDADSDMPSPPILDAGELSESGEEWLPD